MPSPLNACAAASAGLDYLAGSPAVTAQTVDREVAEVCQNVVGAAPSGKHVAARKRSLTGSPQSLEHQRGLAVARRGRPAQGLPTDTGAFAECARAFDPAHGAFGGCVADLKSALAQAGEPSM